MTETMAAAAGAAERPQDTVVRRQVRSRRDWSKIGLGVYFVIFLFFLYVPMILMAILSFQGPYGNLTFPFVGPVGFDWWRSLFDSSIPGSIADDVRASGEQSLWLALAAGAIVAVLGFTLSLAFRRRWRFKSDVFAFYMIMLALMTPAFLVGLGNQLLWSAMNELPSLWKTALGANVVWGIPFSFLVMLAVWNRYDRRIEEAARDLGANAITTFREVTLPLVWTGIFGSFLFGFTLTWNDFDRTILLQNGYETQPLPILIGTWPSSRPIRPDLYALGAATTAVSLGAILFLLIVVSIRYRFRSAPVHRPAEEFGDTGGSIGEASGLAARAK
jgi:putative spermidine/putrescine transport system permease protein